MLNQKGRLQMGVRESRLQTGAPGALQQNATCSRLEMKRL